MSNGTKFLDGYAKEPTVKDHQLDTPESSKADISIYKSASWIQQVAILTQRGWKNFLNDKLVLWGCVFEALFISTFVGFIFFKLDDNLPGILTRKSIFYQSASR